MRKYMWYNGIRLFNGLPDYIKTFDGSKETFKKILDEYLTLLPDEPDTGTQCPNSRTLDIKVSNLLLDWTQREFKPCSRSLNTNKLCDMYSDGGSVTHL